MHATTNAPRTQRKTARTCNVTVQGEWFLLTLNRGKKTDYYLGRQDTGAEFGLAFTLEKQDDHGTADTYHVNLGDRDTFPTCDCPGHCFHGVECKHLAALSALLKADKLPVVLPIAPSLMTLIDFEEGANGYIPPPDVEPRNYPFRDTSRRIHYGEPTDCPAPGRDDF